MQTYIYIKNEKYQQTVLAEIQAENIQQADKQVNKLLGIKVEKTANIGCQIQKELK